MASYMPESYDTGEPDEDTFFHIAELVNLDKYHRIYDVPASFGFYGDHSIHPVASFKWCKHPLERNGKGSGPLQVKYGFSCEEGRETSHPNVVVQFEPAFRARWYTHNGSTRTFSVAIQPVVTKIYVKDRTMDDFDVEQFKREWETPFTEPFARSHSDTVSLDECCVCDVFTDETELSDVRLRIKKTTAANTLVQMYNVDLLRITTKDNTHTISEAVFDKIKEDVYPDTDGRTWCKISYSDLFFFSKSDARCYSCQEMFTKNANIAFPFFKSCTFCPDHQFYPDRDTRHLKHDDSHHCSGIICCLPTALSTVTLPDVLKGLRYRKWMMREFLTYEEEKEANSYSGRLLLRKMYQKYAREDGHRPETMRVLSSLYKKHILSQNVRDETAIVTLREKQLIEKERHSNSTNTLEAQRKRCAECITMLEDLEQYAGPKTKKMKPEYGQ